MSIIFFLFYLSFFFLVSIPIISYGFDGFLKIFLNDRKTRCLNCEILSVDPVTFIADTKPFCSHSMSSPVAPGNSMFSFILKKGF